jgi:hypothetical protein
MDVAVSCGLARAVAMAYEKLRTLQPNFVAGVSPRPSCFAADEES